MPRQLPARPHLDHLKAQAKDLLDAHRRSEADAFRRIRESVPAFARMSDEQLARAPFALHDAQSAIAREYGFASWAELRDKVAALSAAPLAAPQIDGADPIAQLAALQRWSPEVTAALREAIEQARSAPTAPPAPTPAVVPMLPLRNAVAFPGVSTPIDVTRPQSLRAVEAATASEPRFIAIFAQRTPDTAQPTQDDMHPTGCLCKIVFVHRTDAGDKISMLIQGIRWITLEAIAGVDPYYVARVTDAAIEPGDDPRIAELDQRLRATARRFADTRPDLRERAIAFLAETKDIGQIADVAMSIMAARVDESAAYARETRLVRRLELAISALDAELARGSAAARPG